MNIVGNAHVTLPFYCIQRNTSERFFQINSRTAQEWVTDSLSRTEGKKLSFMASEPFQQRLATAQSITLSISSGKPGQLLPVSFQGSLVKRKRDSEDALAVVNRNGKPHLMITMTCNRLRPELLRNILPGVLPSDRPDVCCRMFKVKLAGLCPISRAAKFLGLMIITCL